MAGRRWFVHPILFGVYFVLSLAASNTAELKSSADLLWPLTISLLVSALCWLTAYAWTRQLHKAAILGLLWFVAFSVYGYVAETLRLAGTLRVIGQESGLGVLFALALFGPSLAIRRSERAIAPVNRYATVVALCLIGYTAIPLYRGLGLTRDPGAGLPPPAVTNEGAFTGERPDIYLIILDKYTGGEVLRQHFGFDNTEFEEFLRSRGFIVPTSSRANYPQTPLALASMLNLDYLQNLPRDLSFDELIEYNRLAVFLKSQAYRFAFFPTEFRVTFQNRNADVQLPSPREVKGEFAAVWQNTTMLPELLGGVCRLVGCEASGFFPTPQAADLMDWRFERLKDLAGNDRPVFAFAHLSLPHEPFLYHADCSHRDPYWPIGAGLPGDDEANQGYLDQIRCANGKIRTLVDSILARSRRPSVILLQADHGHGRIGHLPPLDKLNAYQLRERMSVFAAYRLPGLPTGAVRDSVTPVNALRLTLRYYFGADLPPLEDASYWGLEDKPFDLVRIKW